jgi:hypothetical protein
MNDPEPTLWQNLVFDRESATVVTAATAALTRRGLYVVRSFDLRSALATHSECECLQHGTAHCTCQFTVLLVYGDAPQPATLTLHGCAGQTHIAQDTTTCPDPHLAERILMALLEIGRPSPVEGR